MLIIVAANSSYVAVLHQLGRVHNELLTWIDLVCHRPTPSPLYIIHRSAVLPQAIHLPFVFNKFIDDDGNEHSSEGKIP